MQLVSYTTADGEQVTVEVADEPVHNEIVTRSWRESATSGEAVPRAAQSLAGSVPRAAQSLEGALAHIQPAVHALISQLRSHGDDPDEIEIEFGIQFTVGIGAFISAGSTSNFRVQMAWRSATAGSEAHRG